jgi:hypothetical protein
MSIHLSHYGISTAVDTVGDVEPDECLYEDTRAQRLLRELIAKHPKARDKKLMGLFMDEVISDMHQSDGAKSNAYVVSILIEWFERNRLSMKADEATLSGNGSFFGPAEMVANGERLIRDGMDLHLTRSFKKKEA